MSKILLCSTSAIKKSALEKFLSDKFPNERFDIDSINCDGCGLPPQPVNCAENCAKERINYAKKLTQQKRYDYYIAIENGVEINDSEPKKDICHSVIEYHGILSYSSDISSLSSRGFHVDDKYINELKTTEETFYNNKIRGYKTTLGEIFAKYDTTIDPKNWMKYVHNIDRSVDILLSLELAFQHLQKERIIVKSLIDTYKVYPNFPKPGVNFQDFFSLLKDKTSFNNFVKLMSKHYQLDDVDYIIGIESRGFFCSPICYELGVGFIPIRKSGKLPGQVESIEYTTEYSKDKCEIQKDIEPNSKVIVFDDLIATGGSMKACVTLLEKLECKIIDVCVLREVIPLRDIALKTLNRPYTVLLQDE